MTARPILFSGPMVRALLDGRKTQTRRVMKPQPPATTMSFYQTPSTAPDGGRWIALNGPVGRGIGIKNYGIPHQTGDLLWVRENWADVNTESGPAFLYRAGGYHFCADDAYPVEYERYPGCIFSMWCSDLLRGEPDHSWRPSIHMPRWASRLTLRVTDIRAERLQDISEEDAAAEGCPGWYSPQHPDFGVTDGRMPHEEFSELWDSINGKRSGCSWGDNPWVWAISFDVVHQNVDDVLRGLVA